MTDRWRRGLRRLPHRGRSRGNAADAAGQQHDYRG